MVPSETTRRLRATTTPCEAAIAARHNAEALASSDPAQRLGAIQRLAAVPVQRAAAVASLRELVASSVLGAEGRSYVVRWARRQRIPVTVPRAARAAR